MDFAKTLAEGNPLNNTEAAQSFRMFCPCLAVITSSFQGNIWPEKYRYLFSFLIETVEAPFKDTIHAPLPFLLPQKKAENYITDGHLYNWPIVRESKVYPEFNSIEDGSCRKKEDTHSKSKKNLIPGIFLCVCTHQVLPLPNELILNYFLQICYGFHLMTDHEGRKDLFYTLYERWPEDKLKKLTVVSCV